MIDPRTLTNQALEGYDMMMMDMAARSEVVADLAVEVWARVLIELNIRGRVQLLRGSYGDVRHAEIRRLYKSGL